jgi:hypothetical protein
MNLFMGSVLLLAAAGDLLMLLRGGLFGRQRIVRHLRRMCFGLFVATGSFFPGHWDKEYGGSRYGRREYLVTLCEANSE